MKCDVCLQFLEEYIDGELKESDAAPVSSHLVTCVSCASEFEALTAEQEIYSRYDREMNVAPTMWNEIAARTVDLRRTAETQAENRRRNWFALPSLSWSLAGALAVLLIAVALGVAYFRSSKPEPVQQVNSIKPDQLGEPGPNKQEVTLPVPQRDIVAYNNTNPRRKILKAKTIAPISKGNTAADQSDVLFSDSAYAAVEEQETQAHLEKAQNLLRAVRNIEITEDDSDIDVTYEKALSRRLLNENVVLRRDAEMAGNYPAKVLLTDLEPFLLDIANLPDKPAADDLRVLKQRVQKTEIVAALQGY